MKYITTLLLLALAYALAGKMGLSLAFINASATAVWPPAGIALAAFLIFGTRVWPGVLLGAFIVNLSTAGTVFTSLVIAAGNTLEGVAAAYFVNRFAHGREVFNHPYDIFKYTLAALASAMVAATCGVTILAMNGFASWSAYGPVWLTWWLGDAGGMLIVTPFLALWYANPRFVWNRGKFLETGLVSVALALTGFMVFGHVLPAGFEHFPLEFFCTPVVIWAAFRLGQRESAAVTVLFSALAIWGTLHGFGPFAQASSNVSLLLLQTYLGVLSIMSLAVAAVIAERKRSRIYLEEQVQKRTAYLVQSLNALQGEIDERERAEGALRASEARFQRLIESNVIGMITMDGEGRLWEANDAFLKLIGYTREEMRRGELNVRTLTPEEYQTQETWALEHLRERGSCPALEKEFIHRLGNRIPVLVGGVQLERSPERSVCFVIDATSRRRAMEALRKAFDEIELRVEDRTRALSEAISELAKEVARRKQAEAELRNQSLLDPLTGLYNRRGFLALAEQQWLQAQRDHRGLLLFFADVDGLKQINDTMGHQKGDQALEEAAEALRQTFRKSDIIARIGGDEFAVVATQAPLGNVQDYLARLESHLNEINAASRLPFKLSISIGAAEFDQEEATSIAELMRRADEHLYKQKHSSHSL